MKINKPRILKSYEKLDAALKEQIKLQYPYGYSDNLIDFSDQHGNLVSALPFETEDKYYMIKMTEREAERLIELDDDYDSAGELKGKVKSEYEEKYPDIEGVEAELKDEFDDSDDDMDDRYDDDIADDGDDDDDDDDY